MVIKTFKESFSFTSINNYFIKQHAKVKTLRIVQGKNKKKIQVFKDFCIVLKPIGLIGLSLLVWCLGLELV